MNVGAEVKNRDLKRVLLLFHLFVVVVGTFEEGSGLIQGYNWSLELTLPSFLSFLE